jgi:hypothetical protein
MKRTTILLLTALAIGLAPAGVTGGAAFAQTTPASLGTSGAALYNAIMAAAADVPGQPPRTPGQKQLAIQQAINAAITAAIQNGLGTRDIGAAMAEAQFALQSAGQSLLANAVASMAGQLTADGRTAYNTRLNALQNPPPPPPDTEGKKDVPPGTPPSGVNNLNTNCTPSVSPFRSC